jgi:curli biogenesis system outer membrane secretion channel CsgG
MVRAVSLCILALVAVASTSAKSLRGSSAVAAAEQKPSVLSKLIRRAQDNDDGELFTRKTHVICLLLSCIEQR